VIQAKESKVTELETELARQSMTPDQAVEQAQLDEVRDAALQAEVGINALAMAVGRVLGTPATESAALAARTAAEFVAQKLADAFNANGIAVDFAEMVTPHWLAPLEESKTQAKAKAN